MSQLLAGASPRWDGLQLEQLIFGEPATKTWTLPNSATTQNLFVITGGNIVVTLLTGVVTTLIGSTATTLSLGTVPTTGTASTTGLATASTITSAEKGTLLSVQASSGLAAALVVGSNAGKTTFLQAPMGFVVPPGTITATTSANAGGGVIAWYLSYVPLDGVASGQVVAA
jgi:hypothetical protein